MEVLEKNLYGPDVQTVKMITPFTRIYADHPVHSYAGECPHVAHGSLPSPLPSRRQFGLETNNMCGSSRLPLADFDDEIDFAELDSAKLLEINPKALDGISQEVKSIVDN